jgi:hypothetical protein
MTMLKTFAAVAAAVLLWAAPAHADSETATDFTLTATLSRSGDAQDASLKIWRGGVVEFDATIPDVCGAGCKLAGEGDVQIADLDGDGEAEVLVTGFTGGQHCCTIMGVYGYRPESGTYAPLVQDWQASGFDLADLDNDGGYEIVSKDIRFEDRFSDHFGSFPPPAVFHYLRQDGKALLADVTTRFPALISHNAADAKRRFGRLHRGAAGAGGFVAAYVADQFLLERGATGLRQLDRQIARGILGRPQAAGAYRRRLLTLLHRYGYR